MREYLLDQLPRAARRAAHRQPRCSAARGGDAGAARAADDRQGLGARAGGAPHAGRASVRSRDPRCARHRPRRRDPPGAGTFAQAGGVGRIARQAETIDALVRDPARTAVIAVTRPEEMPVNETLELRDALRAAIGLDARPLAVVNARRAVALHGRRGRRRSTPRCRAAARHARRASAAPPGERPARSDRAAAPRPARRRGADTAVPARSARMGLARRRARWRGGLVSGVEAILDGRRVVICAGSGGVGKTTTRRRSPSGSRPRAARVRRHDRPGAAPGRRARPRRARQRARARRRRGPSRRAASS